ncbi:MAG: dephospho-CoA kinase [Rhodoferax sp.]
MGAAAVRLGLTGGIGSGKSTVAGVLARHGAVIIDADAISRATTAAGGAAIAMLKAAFGPTMLTPEGALDRDQMRALVYADPSAKSRLESIVHPLVGQTIALQAQQAQTGGATCLVFDIPLLVESGRWRKMLDRILVVDCTPATQITRVAARNGLSEAEVRKILAAQASRAQRLAAADMVVFNDGITMDELAQQVQEIGPQFGL